MAGDALRLVACPHPFKVERIDRVIPAGQTLADIVLAAGVHPALLRHCQVWIDDWWIPRDRWQLVRPKPGHTITVRAVPEGGGGGGKNPLRTLLTIAVIVASFALGPMLGGVIFANLPLIGGLPLGLPFGVAQALSGAIAGGLISIAGNLLVNAIAPAPKPRLSEISGRFQPVSSTYSIAGTSNRARRYEPCRRVFGALRVYPDEAARSYTEVVGNDQYVRVLLEFGYGPMQLSDIRIGTTPIDLFEDVEYEIREGRPDDAPFTLYTNTVLEDGYAIKLAQADGPRILFSRPDADEITIDITFQGLVAFDGAGNRTERAVDVQVRYRKSGAPDWVLFGTETARGSSEQIVRHGVRIVTGERATYEVELTRLTADNASPQIRDEAYVTAVRTITTEAPALPPGRCRMAARVKASGQLQGIVSQVSAVCTALIPRWTGTGWSGPEATGNPSWVAIEMLRGSANQKPVPDGRLDLPTWAEFASFCDQQKHGEARFRFDGAFDTSRTLWEAVNDVLATARGHLAFRDGKLTVIWDRPQAAPVQMFTPRNSSGFRWRRSFFTAPHALRVRFRNADKDWDEDEVTVYADGYDASNATEFETIEMLGVTRRSQAIRDGRFHFAAARLRPKTYELTVDVEHLVCRRGDLVRVAHDVPRWGLGFGRIKALTFDAENRVTAITLDEQVTLEADKAYALRIRRAADQLYAAIAAVSEASETTVLPLAAPLIQAPEVGDLVAFGESDRETVECLVKGIRRGRDFSAVVELIDYAPAVYEAEDAPIPPYDPQKSFGPVERLAPVAPAVARIVSDETALVPAPGGGWQAQILVELQPRTFGVVRPAELVCRWRRKGAGDSWRQTAAAAAEPGIALQPVDEGVAYELTLAYVTAAGLASEWTPVYEHTVVGRSSPPPDVTGLRLEAGMLRWSYPNRPRDMGGFRVKSRADTRAEWDGAAPAHDGLLAAGEFDVSTLPKGTRTILVKAVDTSGNESGSPAVMIAALGDQLLDNVVLDHDFGAEGFPGTITDGAVVDGAVRANDDGGLYLPDGNAAYLPDGGVEYLPVSWLPMSWETRLTPDRGELPARLTLDAVIDANGFALEYRPPDGGPYLPIDDEAYLADGDAPYLGPAPDFAAWPGEIDADAVAYDFRVRADGGSLRGSILRFVARMDVPDVEEILADVPVVAGGTRLPIVNSYRSVKAVQLTLVADGGTAVTARVLDRDVTGPLVRAFDSAGNGAGATVNAIVQGY